MKFKKEISMCSELQNIKLSFCRYASPFLLPPHPHVDDEHVRHFLHPGGARTLLHRRLRRLLHQQSLVPVLPHPLQQSGLDAEGLEQDEGVVPAFLVFRVERGGNCAE